MQENTRKNLHTENQLQTSLKVKRSRKGIPSTWTRKNPIPIERLIELRKKNLTHAEIAKIIGCTREAVTRSLLRHDVEGLDRFQEHEGSIWAYHRRRVLRSITDKDLQKSTLLQKTIAAGTMMDKQMLKEGKAGRADTLTITVEHRLIAERVVSEIGEYEIQRVRGENQV